MEVLKGIGIVWTVERGACRAVAGEGRVWRGGVAKGESGAWRGVEREGVAKKGESGPFWKDEAREELTCSWGMAKEKRGICVGGVAKGESGAC